jgi:hypothetical protein
MISDQGQSESAEQSNKKAAIINLIFQSRWDAGAKRLSNAVVTLNDLSEAIKEYNSSHTGRPLSDRNPANFFKDFVRRKHTASKNWPKNILAAGFTARQVTGENRCFEFVRLLEGQTEPFPLNAVLVPGEHTRRIRIETISMPLASRRLGRKDEPWLIQVLVKLRIIETHMALFSSRKIIQLDHLQMNVKLSRTEIDALFLAIEDLGGENRQEVFVTCEAKGKSDDILDSQVLEQVKAAFALPKTKVEHVIPLAVKAFAPSQIFVVEFGSMSKEEAQAATSLAVASSAIYELIPPLDGIGK